METAQNSKKACREHDKLMHAFTGLLVGATTAQIGTDEPEGVAYQNHDYLGESQAILDGDARVLRIFDTIPLKYSALS